MAKRIVDEEMRFSIIVNGNEAQKELFNLEKSTRNLTQTNKNLRAEQARLIGQGKKNTEAYKKVTAEIKQNNQVLKSNKARMKTLQDQIGITGLTMAQLTKKAFQLKMELRNMVPGSGQYKKLESELKAVGLRMSELRGKAQATKLSIGSIANGFSKYAALGASVIATLTGVALGLQKLIDYNGKLADAQSNVQKTTGLNKKEVDDLTKSFGLLKTRTARIELLKLAEEAGRLGIDGVKNIQDFVEVANQMKVALGDDLGDEQIREVGKMVKIYKVGERTGRDFKNSLLSLGSAINEVSASGSNQAGFLVDYLKRQAGVSAQTRLSAEDNIAYAATFDEIGQSVEVSATAMNKIWIDMFDDTASYAKIAGMELGDFTNLLNTDANQAMILFLKGLNGNNEGFATMVEKLKDLEVGGARGVQALSALAGNTDLLEQRQTQSNKALSEAVSLTNEYKLKNNNLAGVLDKIKKKTLGWFSSEGLVSFLTSATQGFAKLIGAVEDVDVAFSKETKAISESAKANRNLANESSDLLDEYEKLTNDGVEPTTASKKRLDEITLQLQYRLGDSVVSINNETGALKLNTDAVREQIKLKRLAADEEAATLVSRLKGVQEEQKRLKKLLPEVKNQAEAAGRAQIKAQREMQAKIDAGEATATDFVNLGEIELSLKKRGELFDINQELEEQEKRRIDLLTKLKELNFSEEDAESFFKDNPQVNPVVPPVTPYIPQPLSPKETKDAKKRGDDLLKLQREAEDRRLDVMQDGFDKEMLQEDFNHYRKIEDLQKKLISQELISKAANENLRASYVAQNASINSQIESEDELHQIRKATILEKGIQTDIELKQEQYELDRQARLTAFNNEIAAIGNNQKAREALEKKFDREDLQREKEHLEDLLQEMNVIMSSSEFEGFNLDLLSPEQLNQIKSRLSELGLSISEINALLAVMRGESGSDSIFSGDTGSTDVLGFSADDWVNTFTNIDGLKGGVEAASMAVNGLLNAWSMYSQFQSKNQQQDLANFERANEKKKQKQKQLLDSGFINQRQYDDGIKALEAQAEKRKADMAYKQAKRDKAMALAGAVAGTASAVVGALGAKPWSVANFVLAGIVGALGLAQVGLIAGTKLPAKGYASGYYNVQREQDGKLFNAEFGGDSRTGLVDKPTVFLAGEEGKNFPEMIIDGRSFRQMNPDVKQALYGELARVKGFERGYVQNQTQDVQFNNSSSTNTDPLLISTLVRTNQLLETLERDGVIAVMDKKYRNLKKLQESLDDYNKFKQKQKR